MIAIQQKTRHFCKCLVFEFRDPAGARTQDPNIKSVVLYQLSYGISDTKMGIASVLVVQMYGFIFNMQHPTCNFCAKVCFFSFRLAIPAFGGRIIFLLAAGLAEWEQEI